MALGETPTPWPWMKVTRGDGGGARKPRKGDAVLASPGSAFASSHARSSPSSPKEPSSSLSSQSPA